jgi:hypothetical protein
MAGATCAIFLITMANGTDLFTPGVPLSRDMLEHYAQGGLGPEERHAVELHLESDPLLREALEGLTIPGAIAASNNMPAPRIPGGSPWPLRLLWSAVAIVGATLLVTEFRFDTPIPPPSSAVAATSSAQGEAAFRMAVDSTLIVVHAEIASRASQSTPIGTIAKERFSQRAPSSEAMERKHIERIDGQPVKVEPNPEALPLKVKHARGDARRLVFLHGLKLVHPSELYGKELLLGGSPGVPANIDPAWRDIVPSAPSLRPYLIYMDAALGDYVDGDPRTALDDLYFLLGQYPDDVNAQFYAGLICYQLGLFPRAEQFFRETRSNKVDCFDEEAAWYHALTMERMKGLTAARSEFEGIAQGGGFYAEQAAKRTGIQDCAPTGVP